MPAFLVLAFVVVPLIELAIILQIGQVVGPWWTIALLVLFSVVGAVLLRQQGRRAWRAFRTALEEGRWPGDEVTQGALVIVGGTLLLTPGFLTDGVGLLLLVPLTRSGLSRLIRARLTPTPVRRVGAARRWVGGRSSSEPGRETLDVEIVDIEREPRSPGPDPGSPPGSGTDTTGTELPDDEPPADGPTDPR